MIAKETPRNPFPTVDMVIECPPDGVVLVERRNEPRGWALPGGFVDYGESCEAAAVREALEETGLVVALRWQLGTYSDPARDPRHHTISTVFVGDAGPDPRPTGGDDAADARVFARSAIPWDALCFDHARILRDYYARREERR